MFDIDVSRVVWANAAALEIWRAPSLDELTARDMGVDMSPAVAERLKQYQRDFRDHNASFFEHWTLYPHGEPVTLDVYFSGYAFEDGRMGLLCEARRTLEKTPDRLRSADALVHTTVMITSYDADGAALFRNPAARAATPDGTAPLAARFADPADFAALTDAMRLYGDAQRSARVHTATGPRWHEVTARRATDPLSGAQTILVSEIDVTDLKEAEERAHYLANRDVLTGLYNRHFLLEQASRRLSDAAGRNARCGVVIIDLDNFKAVNDTLGHAAGDQLLIQVAQSLEAAAADRGFAVRLGGDEFLLFVEAVDGAADVDRLCGDLIRRFARDRRIADIDLDVKFSIGASVYPEHGRTLTDLLKNADLALYDAKESGKNTHRLFRPSLRERRETRAQLENDLIDALEAEAFELFLQPRVDAASETIVGAEALLRWRRDDGGYTSPDVFIGACEESGLIVPLGAWALEQAMREQRRLAALGHDLTISVNLSPRQLETPGLAEMLGAVRATTDGAADRIELEITETMLMRDDADTLAALDRIRALGFKLAIDDFGTGYSNLVYLQSFPITSLKIDKSFIRTIGAARSVAGLVLSFCDLLDVKAVAEGVETVQQRDWLRAHGCAEYQGFLFAKPMPMRAFEALLRGPTSNAA